VEFENNVYAAILGGAQLGDMDLVMRGGSVNNSVYAVFSGAQVNFTADIDRFDITNSTIAFDVFSVDGEMNVAINNVSANVTQQGVLIPDPMFPWMSSNITVTIADSEFIGPHILASTYGLLAWTTENITVSLDNVSMDGFYYYIVLDTPQKNVTLDIAKGFTDCKYGVLIGYSNAAMNVSVEITDSNVSTLGGVPDSFALYISAVGDVEVDVDVEVDFENVTFDGFDHGVWIYSTLGDVDATLEQFVCTSGDAVVIGYELWPLMEGGVTLTMTDCLLWGWGSTYSIVANANTTVTVSLSNVTMEGFYQGIRQISATGDLLLTMDKNCSLSLFGESMIYMYAPLGGVVAFITETLIDTPGLPYYAIWIDAEDGAVVSLEDVLINETIGGLHVSTVNGTIDLDMINVNMSSPTVGLVGVSLVNTNGGADVDIENVTIIMQHDDFIGFKWFGDDGISVEANLTVDFDADGLVIVDSWTAINLLSNEGDVDVNLSATETVPEIITTLQSFIGNAINLNAPNGAVELVMSDVVIDNHLQNSVWGYAAISIVSLNDIEMDIASTLMIAPYYPLYAESYLGNIDMNLTDVLITGWNATWWAYMSSGMNVIADEGGVSATLTNVMISAIWPGGNGWGSALSIWSNLSVALTVDGFVSDRFVSGIYVWSDTGDIVAEINDARINDTTDLGIGLYAQAGVINLTLTNSEITNVVNWWLGPQGAIIVQAGGDIDVVMDTVLINNSMNQGLLILSTDGNIMLDLSNIDFENIYRKGIDAVAVNGNIVAEIDPSLIAFCDVAIYLDSAFDLTFEMVDTTIWECDYGIELHAASGFMDIDLESDVFNATDEYAMFAEIDVDDIDFDMVDTTVMGTGLGIILITYDGAQDIDVTDSTFENNDVFGLSADATNGDIDFDMVDTMVLDTQYGIYLVTHDGAQDIDISGSTFDGNDEIGLNAASTNGDIDLYVIDTLVNNSFIGILLDAFNGSLIIEMHGVTVSECYFGLDGYTEEGNITAVIDEESVFSYCYAGIYLDSGEDLNIAMSDSLVEECYAGVELYAGIEPLLVNYDNMTFESNVVYGTFAWLDDGDMFVNVHDSLFNNTYMYAMFLQTYNGTIWLNIDPTTFHMGMWGVYAVASEDIEATVLDSFFLGQSVGGMEMYAGVDVYLDVTNTVFNGEEANNAAIMIPTEVESSYAIVDPDDYEFHGSVHSLNVPLGFDFPFNGVDYHEMNMSYRGWISPNNPSSTSTYAFGSSVNLIAATQYSWTTTEYAGFGYKVNDSRGAMLPNVVFQWYVWDGSQSQLKNVFEIWLYPNGDIEFRYAMMEGQGLQSGNYWSNYVDYGINFANGQNWNLKLLDVDFMNMDWSSVYFSMQAMSAGFGLYTWAGYNTTATITDSEFSHYMTGGAMMFSEEGWMDVLVEETDFSYIYAAYWDSPAALQVGSYGSIIDLTLAVGNSFEYIRGVAIFAFDTPTGGGVSTMSITNMVFHEVTVTAWLMSTVVEDPAAPGTVDFVGTKTFSNNVGEQVGMMLLETNLEVGNSTWTATVNDIMEDNVLTGGVNRWFASGSGGYLETYAMLGTDLDIEAGDAGVATVDWNVAANGNQIEEAGWVTYDYYYYETYTYPVMDAIEADGNVNVREEATVTFNAELRAEGNNLSSWMYEFDEGIDLEADGDLTDGELFFTASMNVNDNLMDFEAGGYWGIDMGAWIDAEKGLGDATLEATYTATNNEIYGPWYGGIYIQAGMDASNQFGAFFSSANALVTDNTISVGGVGVYLYFYNEVEFNHYFPPYEMSVDSSADMLFSSTVTGNSIDAYTGVYLDAESYATEDYYGVFSNASASIAGSLDVTENEIYAYGSSSDDGGVSIYLYVQAWAGDAIATGDFDVTIENNYIDFYGYYGAGIYVETYTDVGTENYRYFDEPTCIMTTDFSFRNLTLYGDGIEMYQYVDGYRSSGEAHLTTNVLVRDLSVDYFWDEGVFVGVYPTAEYGPSYSGYPEVHADVEILVTNLTAYGNSYGSGECVGVEIDSEGYGAYAEGSVTIVENDLQYAYDGVYVWTYPAEVPVLIADNYIAYCSEGIELWNVDMTVERNTLTYNYYYGIDLYGGTGTITDNTISAWGDDDATGIYVDVDDYDFSYPYYDGTAYDLLIEDNLLSDLGEDGIYIEDAMYLTIQSNTFTNIGNCGIWLDSEYDNSYWVTVDQNDFTNIWDAAVCMEGVTYLDIYQNVVDGAGDGIEVYYGYWISIEDNVLANVYNGIDVEDSYQVEILNNVVSPSDILGSDVGLYLEDLEYVLVYNITISGFDDGVTVDDVYQLAFSNSSVTWNLGNGMYVEDSSEVIIENSVFTDNAWMGVYFNDTAEVIFSDNVVNHNGMEGLVFSFCVDVIVYNGEYRNNGEHGIVTWFTAIDWIVDAECIVEANPVDFNGDLTIVEGGVLWLEDVYMEIGSNWYGAPSTITVEQGGEMHAIDTTFDGYWMFEFNVFGVLEMIDSAEYGALELYLGETSQATIETSSIMWNERNGIHVVGCSPVIMLTTIALNERNGMYIEGAAAAPKVTDCIIIMNMRGVYAVGSHLEDLTDNVFALNYEAGVFAEQVQGTIHDNMFLLDGKEIYVKDSIVSIQDNQIGYSTLAQVMMEFMPLLGLANISGDIFLPLIGSYVDTELIINILAHHVGLYATNSEVTTSGNVYGLLTTAIIVTDSELTFGDEIRQNILLVPYMGVDSVIREISMPVPVYDGIVARNSNVIMSDAKIDVLDDALFLDHSTATVSSSTLTAMDFSFYLIRDSHASAADCTFGKVKVEDTSTFSVSEKLTVIVEDAWAAAVANVPVKIATSTGTVVATGSTDAEGKFVATVAAYVQTAAGKDSSVQPYAVTADYTLVPTTGYPGYNAEWSPKIVTKSASISGPSSVTIQTGMIIRYQLVTVAQDPDGRAVQGANVVYKNAQGETVSTGVTNAAGQYSALVIAYVMNPVSGKDTSMNPYDITVTYPLVVTGYPGRVEFNPRTVSASATMDQKITTVTVKTGLIMHFDLTVTAKNKENKTAAGVWIVVYDATGAVAGNGPTNEGGVFSIELVGWTQAADGTIDISMNPYNVVAAFSSGEVQSFVDMSSGSMSIVIMEHVEPAYDWTPVAIMGGVAALVLGAALFVVARKP
jgi:parallel beta-helix repeat protein